ncbi:hypothetical protein ACWCPL_32765, partial [Streptomyces sp. NPDC001948]
MTFTGQDTDGTRMLRGLADSSSSVRLRAALAVGTAPDPRYVDTLVERCAIEPEFFVRDMLTWALTRHPGQAVYLGHGREAVQLARVAQQGI